MVDGFIRKEERNDAGRVVDWCGGERERERGSEQATDSQNCAARHT